MRKVRNPRYAPEFLEKKLSPSTLVSGLVTVACVSALDGNRPLPPPPPPPPPPLPILDPIGPVGPA